MPSFAVSIAVLSLVQAGLVTLPQARALELVAKLKSPWWALVPALSIAVAIGAIELESDSASALSWLALVAVPVSAAVALGWLVHGARPAWALLVAPLFALAWVGKDALLGEAAATALSGLGCIGLGWLLASVAPAAWLRLGIYAMAIVDTWFVAAHLLQAPNAVLSAASPAELPRLQAVHFGSAQMGFGDLFAAALLGCLMVADNRPRRQLIAAALVAVFALAFDLLFFVVDTLPATVPVALALAAIQYLGRREQSAPG
jgi:hypothetical protein